MTLEQEIELESEKVRPGVKVIIEKSGDLYIINWTLKYKGETLHTKWMEREQEFARDHELVGPTVHLLDLNMSKLIKNLDDASPKDAI
ncbi:hypothetical protein JD793_002735 [Citrobacter braakii]|jgi:hypothetical protein|nr:hypothetical protein [Citrobacter braakii]